MAIATAAQSAQAPRWPSANLSGTPSASLSGNTEAEQPGCTIERCAKDYSADEIHDWHRFTSAPGAAPTAPVTGWSTRDRSRRPHPPMTRTTRRWSICSCAATPRPRVIAGRGRDRRTRAAARTAPGPRLPGRLAYSGGTARGGDPRQVPDRNPRQVRGRLEAGPRQIRGRSEAGSESDWASAGGRVAVPTQHHAYAGGAPHPTAARWRRALRRCPSRPPASSSAAPSPSPGARRHPARVRGPRRELPGPDREAQERPVDLPQDDPDADPR